MNRVESAICRIRQKLPGNEGFVTLGSGCIVKCQHLAAKYGWKNPNIIFTSNHVLNKEALASDRVFVAEFISSEKKSFETFDLRSAADTCEEIDCHELSSDLDSTKTNGCLYVNDKHPDSRISLTAISAEHLDKRSFLKRMVKKSILQTSRPIEYYSGDREELISEGFLYCFVIVEKPTKHKSTSDWEIRTFKFTYERENEYFILEQFGAGNRLQYAKDFGDEEKPYGAVISSKKGEFVGVLGFNEGRIFPLFVPPGSSGEVSVTNNNQKASSTSVTKETSEGDHESVETKENQQSQLATAEIDTHEMNEHAIGSQDISEAASSSSNKSLEPSTEKTSTCDEQKPHPEANTDQDLNPTEGADTKKVLAEDIIILSEDADTKEDRESGNEPLLEETKICDEIPIENEVQFEPSDNGKPVEKSKQTLESIQPNAADCLAPESPKSEEKFALEEHNLPRVADKTNSMIREETYQLPDCEISEIKEQDNQQSKKAEAETSNGDVSLTESHPGNIQQSAPEFPEQSETTGKEEKEKGDINETADQKVLEEVTSLENIPEQKILDLSEDTSTEELSGNLDDAKCVSDKPTQEDLSTIETAREYDADNVAGIKYDSQSNLSPSSGGRLVARDSEKEGVQSADITKVPDVQDQILNNVSQADLESHEIFPGTESKIENLDLQQVKILETDGTLNAGKKESIPIDFEEQEMSYAKGNEEPVLKTDTSTDSASRKEIIALNENNEELKVSKFAEDTKKLSVTEENAPLVTVAESSVASGDIKEQDGSKEEQEKLPEKEECGVSFETPELEKGSEILEIEVDEVTKIEAGIDSIAENSRNVSALNTNASGAKNIETSGPLPVETAANESNESVSALDDEESKNADSSAEPAGSNMVESQFTTPVVSSSGIDMSEKVEDTVASEDEGNIPRDKQTAIDGEGPAEYILTQDNEKEPEPEESKSREVQVEVAAPSVVVDKTDDSGQEAEVQTDITSQEKNSCLTLGDDLGICVRSLSDMNVVTRRLTTETLLSEAVTNDPVVLEMLGRHLDIEYRQGHVSCWRDVADLLAVPPALYEHCLAYSKSSPTEDLFVFLAAAKPETTMHDMKEILKRMERVDVVQSIDKYLARCGLNDDIVVGSLVEKEEEYIVGLIAVKLDKPHPQNWKSLASGLEIPRKVFRNFGSQHEHNSALLLLKFLPIFDPELSVAMLKDTLDEIDRSDVVNVLDAAGIPDNDPLKDILDDVELMDQVSDLLNEEGLVEGKNWRHLAKELGVPKEKRKVFEPTDNRPSPAKLLFKTIETFDPDITVEELILALVAMKRHDVLEALKKHFESDDIDKILEENNLLPPADESTCSRLEAEGEKELDYTESSDEHEDYIED